MDMKGLVYYINWLICFFVIGQTLISCAKEPTSIPVVSVTLDSTSMTLIEGNCKVLTATISPANAENKKVLWSSSNSAVATVKEGTVTAIKAGDATIVAKSDDGGKISTCKVIVNPQSISVTGVSLDVTFAEMTVGDELQLDVTIKPDNATNKNVYWTTSNSSVASVSDGKVVTLKEGGAIITVEAEDGGTTAICELIVKKPNITVTGVSLDWTSATLLEEEELLLHAVVYPENATNKKIVWYSNNNRVASVSDGLVTAHKVGSSLITVKTEDGNKTATCKITVKEKSVAVAMITLNKTSAELTEGEDMILTATIKPDNATNKNVTWSSSNTSVVTVNDGKVTTLKAGVATISAKTEDGGHTATCLVEVKTKKSKINYVDEYGIDHGLGIDINGVIWAPVNCGYHETDYIYGKLYQWGRKYGQGYSGELWHNDMHAGKQISDAKYPTVDKGTIKEAYVQIEEGQSYFYSDTFFIGKDNWLFPPDSTLWNKGTQLVPIKNEKYDPCPQGWRIPTYEELKFLRDHNCSEWTTNQFGQDGYYYSGTNAFTFDVPHVFFSGSGRRFTDGDATQRGGCGGYWSSRYKNDEAYLLYIYMGGMRVTRVSCAMGYSIRCVQE